MPCCNDYGELGGGVRRCNPLPPLCRWRNGCFQLVQYRVWSAVYRWSGRLSKAGSQNLKRHR